MAEFPGKKGPLFDDKGAEAATLRRFFAFSTDF
jgi:hypothetical protein